MKRNHCCPVWEVVGLANESESVKIYLKTIYELSVNGSRVRNSDISNALGYSRPSVTNAVKRLSAEGYALKSPSGGIMLTEKGLNEAIRLERRKNAICEFLSKIGADADVANENAVLLEHIITDELYDLMCTYHQ